MAGDAGDESDGHKAENKPKTTQAHTYIGGSWVEARTAYVLQSWGPRDFDMSPKTPNSGWTGCYVTLADLRLRCLVLHRAGWRLTPAQWCAKKASSHPLRGSTVGVFSGTGNAQTVCSSRPAGVLNSQPSIPFRQPKGSVKSSHSKHVRARLRGLVQTPDVSGQRIHGHSGRAYAYQYVSSWRGQGGIVWGICACDLQGTNCQGKKKVTPVEEGAESNPPTPDIFTKRRPWHTRTRVRK